MFKLHPHVCLLSYSKHGLHGKIISSGCCWWNLFVFKKTIVDVCLTQCYRIQPLALGMFYITFYLSSPSPQFCTGPGYLIWCLHLLYVRSVCPGSVCPCTDCTPDALVRRKEGSGVRGQDMTLHIWLAPSPVPQLCLWE